MALELDTWAMPGVENFGRYDIDENWGEGVVVRAPDSPSMYLRFYEWNLFGAVREGVHTQADRNQPSRTTCDGERATVEYPEHGVSLELSAGEASVDLTLSVTNGTGRDWGPLAALVPCLTPGRDGGPPKETALADREQERTHYVGRWGPERLEGRAVHWLADHREAVEDRRPAEGYPWAEKWPTGRDATEGLLLRESTDGEWVTGIAWEDALSVQGHNPWYCLHLSARVGPLAAGETRTVAGRIYLSRGDVGTVRERYREEFE